MNYSTIRSPLRSFSYYVVFLSCSIVFGACASIDPAQVDFEMKKSQPEVKLTSYTEALVRLGLMTEIYDTGSVLIQSHPVGDKTGTSASTGGEIPSDITEMLKSTLNTIGGNIRYIPYNPEYMEHMNITGYSDFSGKLIPQIVISGGITEFDRGLQTVGSGTNIGTDVSFTNAPRWTPDDSVGLNYSDSDKMGLARITLDFNMLDFATMAGIPRMSTVNTLEVHKGMREKELGITLFGPTFGRKGSVKKVEGRHAAVRVLVEMSMIQMVGKYLSLPYWRLLGSDALPDPVVSRKVKRYFYSMDPAGRVSAVQQWLYLYGENVGITGILDRSTSDALSHVIPSFPEGATSVDYATFAHVYNNIPIDERTLSRRGRLNQILAAGITLPGEQGSSEKKANTEKNVAGEKEQKEVVAKKEQKAAKKEQKKSSPFLGLEVAVIYRPGNIGEFVLMSGDVLKSGEQYKIVVEPEQNCYLYVLQRDSVERLFPIFPNMNGHNRYSNPVRGRKAYVFPNDDNYFYLDQQKGREQIYFYTSEKPDTFIEDCFRTLANGKTSENEKLAVEKKLFRYLAAKDTVNATTVKKSYSLRGDGGQKTVNFNRVQRLGNNKLYVFLFEHK